MAKKEKIAMTKYMVIDITNIEHTAVVKVAYIREAALWGHLYKAQGRNVIVRAINGKSFAALEKLPLQYLYWNTCQQIPPEDYGELVKTCLAALNLLEVAETTCETLESEIELIYPGFRTGKTQEVKAAKDPNAPTAAPNAPTAAPKATSICGVVWAICEELFKKAGNQMPERASIIKQCVEVEQINAATAATQYARWKGSKLKSIGS